MPKQNPDQQTEGGDPVADAPRTLDDQQAAVSLDEVADVGAARRGGGLVFAEIPPPPIAEAMAAKVAAEAAAAPAEPKGDERIPVTVLLTPRHFAYLQERAALHGETPERHFETILRNFRAYFDDKRPELTAAQAYPGGPPVTRRIM